MTWAAVTRTKEAFHNWIGKILLVKYVSEEVRNEIEQARQR